MSPSEKTQPRLAASTAEQARVASGPAGVHRPGATAAGAGTATGVREPLRPDPATTGPRGGVQGADEHPAEAPRRVRLTVARLDLWSVAKLAFLLSVALGIVFVVAVAVVWSLLDAAGVFSDLQGLVGEVLGGESRFDLMSVLGLSRVLSVAVFVAVLDVVLVTALATLGAFLYNTASSLVGGLRLTLSDD